MEIVFSPSDFVAVVNQTMEYAYPLVTIEGELANVRVSRGKWVYFDVKDEFASVKCFGTVYVLPGPIEEGMMVRIVASPRLHPLYNFSLNLQSVVAVGEGSIKRASDLLFQKLTLEGLFDPARKRSVPPLPTHVGLIASGASAAYGDFMKILNERWCGVKISHIDVQVQGEPAVKDIVAAIEKMNLLASPPEAIVITRGGGSLDDLAVFSSEQVVRAIASSRIPTVVAIGHEQDVCLGELAADRRASTPSNAAETLVPNKKEVVRGLKITNQQQTVVIQNLINAEINRSQGWTLLMGRVLVGVLEGAAQGLVKRAELLAVLNPEAALRRGYAVVRAGQKVVKSVKLLKNGDKISLQLQDGVANATINL